MKNVTAHRLCVALWFTLTAIVFFVIVENAINHPEVFSIK